MNLGLYVALRSESRAASSTDQSVLLVLAGYANDDGMAWPSIGTLKRDTKLAESTIRASIRSLEAVGHVVRYPGGGNTSNRYRVVAVDALTPPAVGPLHQSDPSGTWRGPLRLATVTPPAPGPNEVKMKQRRSNPRGAELESSFAAFYALYPKKTERKDALAVWLRLKPDADLVRRICESVTQHAKTHDWTKDGGKWVPSPRKFLHGARWDDEIAATTGAPSVRELPDVTAWRHECRHEPACQNIYEHEKRSEAIRVTA